MGTFSNVKRLRSLADDLRNRTDAQLQFLFQQRPDLMHPVPNDVSQLATRATTSASTSSALDSLNLLELTLCEILAALPDGISLAETLNELKPIDGFDEGAVTNALGNLWQLALVWGDETSLHLVRSVRESYGKYACALGPAMAPLRREIAEFVADPEFLSELINDASADAKEILIDLAWEQPQRAYKNAARVIRPENAKTTAEWLLAHNLIIAAEENTIVMPREVAMHLRGNKLVKELPNSGPALIGIEYPIERIDSAGIHGVLTALSSVEELISALAQEPISPLRSGGLAHRDFVALSETCSLTPENLALYLEVSFAAGLIACDETYGWMPANEYDRWLTKSDEARWQLLANTWTYMDRAPHLINAQSAEKVTALSTLVTRTHFGALRANVLSLLMSLPDGQSVSKDEVISTLAWRAPRRFSQTHSESAAAIIAEAELLGITGANALTSYGRLVAGGNDASTVIAKCLPPFVEHIIVQADLTALAPGRLPVAQRRTMALIAEVESAGVATTYRFTPASILRAIDYGKNAGEIKDFLLGISRTELPQPLLYLIDDVARKHGHLRMGHATVYLRCDDSNILNALLADKRLKPLKLRQLAEGIIITEQSDDIVLRKLRDAGYSPTAENADGTLAITATKTNRGMGQPAVNALIPRSNPERYVAAAIKSIRAGERATQVNETNEPSSLKTSTKETLEILSQSLQMGCEIWISYSDKGGLTTARIIEPLTISGGFLTAFDTRTSEVKTFTISRISGAQFLDEPKEGAAS